MNWFVGAVVCGLECCTARVSWPGARSLAAGCGEAVCSLEHRAGEGGCSDSSAAQSILPTFLAAKLWPRLRLQQVMETRQEAKNAKTFLIAGGHTDFYRIGWIIALCVKSGSPFSMLTPQATG